jgi:hypothetical protein
MHIQHNAKAELPVPPRAAVAGIKERTMKQL